MMKLPKRHWTHAASFLTYVSLSLFITAGCAQAIGPGSGNPVFDAALAWDIVKWLAAAIVAIVLWSVRVEMTLARLGGQIDSQGKLIGSHDEIIKSNARLIEKHESLLESHCKTLEHIESILEQWTDVKEQRGERLGKIETRLESVDKVLDKIEGRLDRLDKIEGKLDYVLTSRQDRYLSKEELP